MTKWETETIDMIRKVIDHGWGKIIITISADGKRKHRFYGYDDIDNKTLDNKNS